MRRVIVCDVNETLLDIGALAPLFEQAFGDGRVLQEWFQTVLLYSEVATLAGPYWSFANIGGAALEMTANAHGVKLTSTGHERILKGMLTLPPHADVRAGLEAMRDAGLRLVTLTNNPPETVHQQLAHAGLAELFDQSFSVEIVQRFKPAPECYRFVADALSVTTKQLRLVAAHAWDVLGALRAGCAAAFVARPGQSVVSARPATGYRRIRFRCCRTTNRRRGDAVSTLGLASRNLRLLAPSDEPLSTPIQLPALHFGGLKKPSAGHKKGHNPRGTRHSVAAFAANSGTTSSSWH